MTARTLTSTPLITLCVGLAVGACPARSEATWSIVAMDCSTGEVAVGSATCLSNFDLLQGLPVMMVELGGAAAQSQIDSTGANRVRIKVGFLNDWEPTMMLEQLDFFDAQHESRQYGIVDQRGRTATFTGNNAGAFADGVEGQFGSIAYAIQGNVITGLPVLEMAEDALINAPGDLPDKLMAAMEAARSMGGDGRCSCTPGNPTACGSPPETFDKSAHIGFVIVSRPGDSNGVCNADFGCAAGDYFLNLNVAFQMEEDPDPVVQLQGLYSDWRNGLIGRADAVHSTVSMSPPAFPAGDPGNATLMVTLLDWQDVVVDDPALTIDVVHHPDSPATATIGTPSYIGGGSYEVPITSSTAIGVERFSVTVNDPVRPVVVMPDPVLVQAADTDLELDGDVDLEDGALLNNCLTGPDVMAGVDCLAADVDISDTVDMSDFAAFQNTFTAPPCKVLYIREHPFLPSFTFCGGSIMTSVDVQSDPPATLQWLLDGVPIPGAASADYIIDSATEADEGTYSVLVINSCGAQISDEDGLVVVPDPKTGPCDN